MCASLKWQMEMVDDAPSNSPGVCSTCLRSKHLRRDLAKNLFFIFHADRAVFQQGRKGHF